MDSRRDDEPWLGYAVGPRARMACGWEGGYYACKLELSLASGRRAP